MFSLIEVSVLLVAIYSVYYFLHICLHKARLARATTEHGCRPVAKARNWDPFLGIDNFIKIAKVDKTGHRSEAYRSLHKKYGPTYLMKALGAPILYTMQPENIKAICATSFSDFGVGPIRGNIGLPFFGRGVFTEDGEFWKYSRSLIRPTFNKAEIADLPNFEQHVARFLALIPDNGRTIDILPLSKMLVGLDANDSVYSSSSNIYFSS